jgi:hypothetical protein
MNTSLQNLFFIHCRAVACAALTALVPAAIFAAQTGTPQPLKKIVIASVQSRRAKLPFGWPMKAECFVNTAWMLN